jgi:hypothetical protein
LVPARKQVRRRPLHDVEPGTTWSRAA